MLTPIAQMTCRNTNGNAKLRPNAMTVSSSTISHAPRVSRKRESLRLVLAARSLQVHGNAGEEDERRCAQMCDPTREVQPDVRARRIGRIEGVSGNVEVVARVVEHHQRDDEAAQQVDHVEARHTGSVERHGRERSIAGLRVHASEYCEVGLQPDSTVVGLKPDPQMRSTPSGRSASVRDSRRTYKRE